MELHKDGAIATLTLHGQGLFNGPSLAAFNAALDEVWCDTALQLLVITGQDKVFAQGLDLQYISAQEPNAGLAFVYDCIRSVARLLTFPVPVVAAVNGHAFGLGAMISLASDYAVMRADRGYFCLPEIDLGVDLIPPMHALVSGKLTGRNLRDVLFAGRRIAGPEAAQRGIVDECCQLEELHARAVALAQPMTGKDRHTLGLLKRGAHAVMLARIVNAIPPVPDGA